MKRFAPLLLASLLLAPEIGRAASFTPLGDLPGGDLASTALGVSADGTVVVGFGVNESGDIEAFRWSGGVMVGLGILPPVVDPAFSYAFGVSADGSIVVGESAGGQDDTPGSEPYRSQAFLWSGGVTTGLESLGGVVDGARAVSADGSIVVGYSGGQAVRWVGGAVTALEPLPGGGYSGASGVSADGGVVVGTADDSAGTTLAVRWDNGVISSIDHPESVISSDAHAVSADGGVVVGSMRAEFTTEAFRWSDGEVLGLGFLQEQSWAYSEAHSVSGDGSIVVGLSETDGFNRAFIWTEAHGMQPLFDLLVATGATGLEGWSIYNAHAISPDGRWIVGTAVDPDGFSQAFLAEITSLPEPSAAWLLGSALAALACARRRASD